MTRQKGMTLLEVTITLLILSLIVGIAYPVYTQSIVNAHRTVALSDLLRIQLELEKEFDGDYSFENIISGGKCLICDSDAKRFEFSISTSNGYTIKAKPPNDSSQLSDSCFDSTNQITLDAMGNMLPNTCWY